MRAQEIIDTKEPEHALNRRLRDLRAVASKLTHTQMTPFQVCESIVSNRLVDPDTRRFFLGLPADEKHYWIASLYALLMPKGRRRRLAAYFTPPHLVNHSTDLLIDAGVEPGKHRILDPASGGAAFLVPLADRIATRARRRGAGAETILRTIETTLAGVEIEPHLAKLSQVLLADLLRHEIAEAGRSLNVPLERTNTLRLAAPETLFDAVVGNPPYGRVYRPSKFLLERFSPVITEGYVNLYALFIEQALRLVRPGGVVCLVVPVSFVGGPYFKALRKRILETSRVLRLDLIDKRSDLFVDVLYDVGILVLQRSGGHSCPTHAASSLLTIDEPPRHLGYLDIPARPSDRIWALPDGTQDDRLFRDGLETLQDYGYIAKTGYFVWNREQHRYRTGYKPRSTEVPLFWAHNVRANAISQPSDGEPGSKRIGFVKVSKDSSAIIRSDAIILQRTTNRRQKRRLVAAVIRKNRVPGERGFVSENHTIVIIPDPERRQVVSLRTLCRLLNTRAVDARFRRISGSVSVSTRALGQLPLPAGEQLHAAFKLGLTDEEAAELAYMRSTGPGTRVRPADQKSSRGRHGA